MPHVDWTISLGNVLINALTFGSMIVFGIVKIYNAIDKRVAVFESVLKTHAESLVALSTDMKNQEEAHNRRIEKQDDLLLRIVGDVQRLVGRLEARHGGE